MCAWCLRLRSGYPSKSVCDGDLVDGGRSRVGRDCAEELARVMRLYTLVVARHPDLSHLSPSKLFAAALVKASSYEETREAIRKEFAA